MELDLTGPTYPNLGAWAVANGRFLSELRTSLVECTINAQNSHAAVSLDIILLGSLCEVNENMLHDPSEADSLEFLRNSFVQYKLISMPTLAKDEDFELEMLELSSPF